VPSETVWKSERGRSMTYAPEYGKVLSDRSFGRWVGMPRAPCCSHHQAGTPEDPQHSRNP